MKKQITIFILVAVTTLLLTACGKSNEQSSEQTTSGNRHQKAAEVSVVTDSVVLTNLDEYSVVTGKLEGIAEITVIAEVSGKIISISKGLGDYVKAGEEIAKIDNKDIESQLAQAQASTLAAKANFDSESIKHSINSELYGKKSISEVEYILSKSSYETAKANYDGAKANQAIAERKYDNSRFTASVSGKIGYLPIRMGQYIPIGSEVAKIVDDSKMIIRTGVGASTIQKIMVGDEVELVASLTDQTAVGFVTAIGLTPGSDNFNYPLEIEVINDQNLLSGQLVKGNIKVKTYENIISINPSSIISYYDKKIVYVVTSDNLVEQREVDVLVEVSERCIIESGLSVGDQLIIQGQDLVKDGLLVKNKKSSEILNLTQFGE